MLLQVWSVLTLLLASLSLTPSLAHVLEAPPRLKVWPQQLWIDATVHHGQFTLFRSLGGPIDVAAILAATGLALLLRGEVGFRWAIVGVALLVLALGAWLALVAPANTILASWRQGASPTDFQSVRTRWETGHMVVAAFKLAGLVALALAAVPRRGA